MTSSKTDAARPYRGVARDERQAERRSRLLRAAVKLYGERGYANVGVRAVCAEAGLTERYFYESFENGEALLVASLNAIGKVIRETLETAMLTATSPETRVANAVAAFFQIVAANPGEARFFLRGLDGVSAEVEAARHEVFLGSLRLFDRATGRAVAGSLLTAGIVGGIYQIARAWLREDFRTPTEIVIDDAERLCAAALESSKG